MPDADLPLGEAEEPAQLSENTLEKARRVAAEDHGYNSETTRQLITKEFSRIFQNKPPYFWQIEIAEAILLGLDATLIAGTGSGKTIPFILPLLVPERKDKMVLIVSPLKELQRDQVLRFNKMGLNAKALNQDTWSAEVLQRIVHGEFRVLLAGPEMCLEHRGFASLFQDATFGSRFSHIVVDEAHCVAVWGDKFRTYFSQLERLRSMLPHNIPMLACSATLPPAVLANVRRTLGIPIKRSYHLNLGNRRSNITKLVFNMKGAGKDLDALQFLVDGVKEGQQLAHTIIFCKTRETTQKICSYLRKNLPASMCDEIDYMHGMRTKNGKRRVMHEFRECKINILCSTDCAAMGTDDAQAVLIIEFLAPDNVLTSTQHAGRAGRAGQASQHIIMVENTAFQLVKLSTKKKKPQRKKGRKKKPKLEDSSNKSSSESGSIQGGDTDSEREGSTEQTNMGIDMPCGFEAALPQSTVNSKQQEQAASESKPNAPPQAHYKKKIDPILRELITTTACRNTVLDEFFANPQPAACMTVPCCNNCIRTSLGIPDLSFHQIRSLLHIHAALGTPRSSLPAGIPDIIAPPTSPLPGQSFVKIKAEFFGTSNRIKKLRGDVEAALIKWRYTKWKECYSHSGLEPTHILANDEMKVFVDKMFPSLDAVQAHPTLSTWPFLNLHGQDVLDRVSLYDRRHEEELIAAKEKRKAEKRKATEDKKAERERKKQKLQEDRNKEKEMWRNRMGEVIASKPGKIIGQSSRTPHT